MVCGYDDWKKTGKCYIEYGQASFSGQGRDCAMISRYQPVRAKEQAARQRSQKEQLYERPKLVHLSACVEARLLVRFAFVVGVDDIVPGTSGA
jgi:hypothetical protein